MSSQSLQGAHGRVNRKQGATFGTAAATVTAGATATGILFGVATGQDADDPDAMTATQCDTYFANAYTMGARVVRLPGDESDTTTQKMVTSAQNAGLEVNLLFVSSTSTTLVSSVVTKYFAQGVTRFEGTNEPNLNNITFSTYRTQNNAMYAAAKAAAPNCIWISGALAPYGGYAASSGGGQWDPVWYMEQLLAVGPLNCDRVGYHPYNWFNISSATPYGAANTMLSLVDDFSGWGQLLSTSLTHTIPKAFINAGHTVPRVDATELGCPTVTNSSQGSFGTQQLQADMVNGAIPNWKTWQYAGDLYFYTLHDQPSAPAGTEQNFGLMLNNYTYKLGATAFQNQVT